MTTGTSRDAAIAVRGLVKRYGERAVVDGVSLDVNRGEVLALLGPNGAGKTTTVEIIEGYRRADGGEVRVLGIDPRHGGRALRARVGVMLQQGGFEPRARPLEILRLYAAFHTTPRDPDELIDLVGLRDAVRTRYRRLSGGERQRLALAVALVGGPEVLILDEPTAGMDPAARAATRDLIAKLRGEGLAILLTTHDLVDVERVADRVAILVEGRIVASGTPADLVADARERVTVRFRRALTPVLVAGLQAALQSGSGNVHVTAVAGDASSVIVDGSAPDPALVAAIAAWAASRDFLVAELRTSGGSLEDRYLELAAGALDGTGETARVVDAEDVA